MRASLIALTFLTATVASGRAEEPPVVNVTVTAKGCEPNDLTVKAGRVTFLIKNASSRALEWEILKGVMIIDERENIAPGFKQKLTTTLEPGEYETACGLLSNPRGKLSVVNADGGTTLGLVKPSASDLLGVLAEHRVWLIGEAKALTKGAGAGDRSAARAAFLRLSALKGLAAPQASALEAALAAPSSDLSGAAQAYADALRAAQMTPLALAGALETLAQTLASAPAADAPALFAGLEAQAALLAPATRRADPALAQRLDEELATARAALANGTAPQTAALAADIGKLPATLGLN